MTPQTSIYTVSREIVHSGLAKGEPRWLLRDGIAIALVSSDGPAVVGRLTEADARRRFPRAVDGSRVSYEGSAIVVTWQTASGWTIDLTPAQEQRCEARGVWPPPHASGEAYLLRASGPHWDTPTYTDAQIEAL